MLLAAFRANAQALGIEHVLRELREVHFLALQVLGQLCWDIKQQPVVRDVVEVQRDAVAPVCLSVRTQLASGRGCEQWINGGDVGATVPAGRLLEVDGGTRWGEVGQGQALLDCLMEKLVSVSRPGLNQTAFLPAFAPHAAMR